MLRIATGAGVGALVGAAACSSDPRLFGTVVQPPDAGEDAQIDPCASRVCGSVAVPPDAGADSRVEFPGVVVQPPPHDAQAPCDGQVEADYPDVAVVGLFPQPPDAGDGGCWRMVCGAVARPPDGGPPPPACWPVSCDPVVPDAGHGPFGIVINPDGGHG